MRENRFTRAYATGLKIARNKTAAWQRRLTSDAEERSRLAMFHDVLPDGAPVDDPYACSLSALMQSVHGFTSRGFTYVSLDALLSLPRAQAEKRRIVLTFDDGFQDLLLVAAPALFANGVPFTAYITTGFLDTPGYLTVPQLRELAANPLVTVGSHTVTHPMTRFLTADAVMEELTASKARLEDVLGREVRHFAFPYGSAYACSLRDVRLTKRAGYETAALTTDTFFFPSRSPASAGNDRYRLPRQNMPGV